MASRCFTVSDVEKKEDDQELPESLQLHQTVVRKIGEICRIVNQVRNDEPVRKEERNHPDVP